MARSARLKSAELAIAASYLRRIAPVTDSDLHALFVLAEMRELARGEFLLRAGERATQTGVVLQGLVREYFVLPDGTERTKAFVIEGQSTGSLADLLSAQPSRAFIVAEEPVRLFALGFLPMRALFERSPAWTAWGVRLLEIAFVNKAQREYELLGMDAQARYVAFAQRFPGLEARIAARHVASYLGITAVHLSRLRRRRLVSSLNPG
jgi:CRP-like cAMP-binding protein